MLCAYHGNRSQVASSKPCQDPADCAPSRAARKLQQPEELDKCEKPDPNNSYSKDHRGLQDKRTGNNYPENQGAQGPPEEYRGTAGGRFIWLGCVHLLFLGIIPVIDDKGSKLAGKAHCLRHIFPAPVQVIG